MHIVVFFGRIFMQIVVVVVLRFPYMSFDVLKGPSLNLSELITSCNTST